MAFWLTRAGRHGEYEQKFLDTGRAFFTWTGLNVDLGAAKDLQGMYDLFREVYPAEGTGKLQNWGRQAAQFFRVRLWDRDDLLENLFKTYDKLPESFRAEVPLKRTWVMVQED